MRVLGALAIVMMAATGCAAAKSMGLIPFVPAEPAPEADGMRFHEEYRIGPGDQLRISEWSEDKLSEAVTVYPDGRISFPLIGDMMAEGKTPAQLAEEIEAKIEELQNVVEITVIVSQINSLQFSVLGEGVQQGVYQLTHRTTILEAVANAGGFGTFTERNNVILIRQVEGAEKRYRFDFDDFVENPNSPYANVELVPGDVLLFP